MNITDVETFLEQHIIKLDTTQPTRTMDTKTNKYNIIQQMPEVIITHEEVTRTINSIQNWKASGKAKIANF